MKKLGKLKLHNVEVLSDSEMKNVLGGSGAGAGSGMCQYLHMDGTAYYSSKSGIMDGMSNGHVQKWCCDSCDEASWSHDFD